MPKFEPMPETHPEAEHFGYTCASCQWFTAGFNGMNCQRRRGVNANTKSCVEYVLPLDDYFHDLVQDKYVVGVREAIAVGGFIVDDSVLKEVRSYILEGDFSKYSFGSTQDLQAMTEHLKKIIQYRARVSNIYTNLLDMKHDLDALVGHALMWLYAKYSVMRNLKNENARRAALHRLVPGLIQSQESLEKAIATTKHIDEKLDANERTLGKILSASERLWFSKKGMG